MTLEQQEPSSPIKIVTFGDDGALEAIKAHVSDTIEYFRLMASAAGDEPRRLDWIHAAEILSIDPQPKTREQKLETFARKVHAIRLEIVKDKWVTSAHADRLAEALISIGMP